MRNNKGITLIALVITIIVMLILVGVSVTVALNGGLFSRAQSAVSDTEAAKQKELELSNGDIVDKWVNGTAASGNEQSSAQTYTITWNLTDIEGMEELPTEITSDGIANVQLSATNGYLPPERSEYNVVGAEYLFWNDTLIIQFPTSNVTVTASAWDAAPITFTVNNSQFYAKSGETWAQLAERNDNCRIEDGVVKFNNYTIANYENSEIINVSPTDTIIDNTTYSFY